MSLRQALSGPLQKGKAARICLPGPAPSAKRAAAMDIFANPARFLKIARPPTWSAKACRWISQ